MPTKNVIKDVQYLSRDYTSSRKALIDFAKVYFPDEYNDFSDASVGMMFIEMSSYISDVMSLYIDTQLRESFLQTAVNFPNIINNAQSHGYSPRMSSVANTFLDVYQLVPAIGTTEFEPDWRYALRVSDIQVSSKTSPSIKFYTDNVVDFSASGSDDLDISIYRLNQTGDKIEYFLLKKPVRVTSGNIITKEFTIGNPQAYLTITMPDENIINILDVYDSSGNKWYEVPYLAQDTVTDDVPVNNITQFANSRHNTSFLLMYKTAAKRFIKRINTNGQTEICFGAGTSAYPDELIIPTPYTVGYTYFNKPLDPRNFLNTNTYGQAPSNTTLTIRYIVGNNLSSNVQSNELTSIINMNTIQVSADVDDTLMRFVINSVACNNASPAVGSRGPEGVEEIRNNALAYFSAQDRCVTLSDYEVRILSMHPKYGSISKVKVQADSSLIDKDTVVPNQLALNAYCLTYDKNKNLTVLNDAMKYNLINYLGQYRMATDAINIKNANIVNIAIEFDITTYDNVANKREVLLACVESLKSYFNIDNWSIGQPVIISEITNILDRITGVMTINNIKIINKYDVSEVSYSAKKYNIPSATMNGIIYPPMDPSIFEVKYPNVDISGRAK